MKRALRLLSTLAALSVSLAARADVGPEIVLSPRELAYSREQALSAALAVNAAGVWRRRLQPGSAGADLKIRG